MKKLYLSSITFFLLSICSNITIKAQGGVAINTAGAEPDSSALIDVSSLSKGALLPRMSAAQRDAIANPAAGLTIFNTDCHVYNYNAGTPANPVWATINASNALIAGVSIVVSPLGPICAGASTTFSATPASGIPSPNYQWQVNGHNVGTNSSLYTTSSLNDSDVVTCILSSTAPCVAGSPATSNAITMSINPNPSTPGPITGDTLPCPNSTGNTYSINAVANATSYSWTVPNDATITAGVGTTSITVTWGSTSGNVSVVANNNCTSSSVNSLVVTTNSAPSTPGPISGPVLINTNSTGTYSVSPVANATSYVWTVTNGNITSGQVTDSINVTWQSTTGNVSVVASNSCGSSSSQNLSTGPQTQTFSYTGGTQYFTVPAGVTSVTIEAFGAQGGNNGTYTGGYGADIKGTFNVNVGDVLSIGVGGQAPYNYNSGGGGGSSGVTDANTSTLLIVAGGGGGAGEGGPTATYFAMSNAVTGTSGQNTYGCYGGTGTLLGTGGTNGDGGGAGTNPCGDWPQGSGGAGIYSNGGNADGGDNGPCSGGLSSGAGGSGDNINGGGNGGWGFTGGGGASYGGGGGGGYSGGAGGASSPAGDYVTGGGGGSYNAGTNQTNTGGVQNGNGQVIISW